MLTKVVTIMGGSLAQVFTLAALYVHVMASSVKGFLLLPEMLLLLSLKATGMVFLHTRPPSTPTHSSRVL